MGTRPTAIVSCFGLIGILIALIAGEKSNEAKYFIRQSANATICTILVSTIVGVVSAIFREWNFFHAPNDFIEYIWRDYFYRDFNFGN